VKAISNYTTANNTATGVIMGVDSIYNNGIINNDGTIKIMTFYNDNTINNYGTMQGLTTVIDSMFNAGTLLNDVGALLKADSCTNSGTFTNNGIVNFDQYTNSGTFTNTNYLSFVDITNTGIFTNQDSLIGTGSMYNLENFDNQNGAIINLGVSLLNSDPVNSDATFNNDGKFTMGDSFYNFDAITGGATGGFIMQDTSYNGASGSMTGSFDFCDMTPPASSPFIDLNFGTVSPTITYCVGVGIVANNVSSTINIYPNPTTGILNIEMEENFTIDIYNVLGEKVITTNDSKINLSSYQNGIYFVLLKDEIGNLIKQEKIIKH
jgi:hypothetical protein